MNIQWTEDLRTELRGVTDAIGALSEEFHEGPGYIILDPSGLAWAAEIKQDGLYLWDGSETRRFDKLSELVAYVEGELDAEFEL